MNRILLIISSLVILIMFSCIYFATRWPTGELTAKLYLTVYADELEGIVNIASTYPYTHITWVNEQITEIGIIKENRFQRIQDADISKLIDFAKNQNRQGLELYKSEQGNWHFPLFNQTIKTNNAVVKISTQYIFNNQTHTTLKNCGSIEYSKVADGECMVAIFDKWVLHKYWFTTAFKNGI